MEEKKRTARSVNNSSYNKTNTRRGVRKNKTEDDREKNLKLTSDTKAKLNSKDGVKVEFENIDTRPVVAKTNKPSIFAKPRLKIIPLGGMNEIGKNITVFEYDNEIIIVDCGLAFPEDDMLGVDLVIPDITYLERNKDKVKAIVITPEFAT